MKTRPLSPPNTTKAWQALVVEREREIAERDHVIVAHESTITALTQNLQDAEQRALLLQERLNLALAYRYAARSEKSDPRQLRLFDEAEAAVVPDLGAEDEEGPGPLTVVAAHTRVKPSRKPLPKALPRVDVVYELPESERICPQEVRLYLCAHAREVGQVRKDRRPAEAADSQEHGLTGLIGPYRGLQVPGCLAPLSPRRDP